jgi:hypothetical protein
MVNSGIGIIKCQKCNSGCSANTSVNRNKSREENVVSVSCQHFEMRISILTNSNYLSWIMGSRDRISFYLYAKCRQCDQGLLTEKTCEGFDVDDQRVSKSCCGNEVEFTYTFFQTFFDANIVDIIRNLPGGFLLPANVATRIEDNLKTATF